MNDRNEAQGRRVLVLAPTGRDSKAACLLLEQAGVQCTSCSGLDELQRHLEAGAGAAVIAQEAFAGADLSLLFNWVATQPPWSDFPFVLLTARQDGNRARQRLLHLMERLQNVTLQERPIEAVTLISTVRSSLRSRQRQYEAATYLTEREQAASRLEELVGERTREVREVFAKLHESERQFRYLVESVADYAIFLLTREGVVTSWNTGAERIKGYTAEEIIGQHFSIFYSEEDRGSGLPARALATARRTGRFGMEGWRVRKGGARFWASVIINAVHDEHGQLIGFAKVTRDLTERRAIEDQLRQMQKMEAIGQLTGGIAHDFNNMLQVISGNIETLQRRMRHEDSNTQRLITAALHGAERASTLTHRLLSYSRQQPLDPKPIDLNRLVPGMSDLLTRTLGEHIKLESVLSGGLWHVLVDPNQVENAILNLAVNARDAMPDGGKLTIETANIQ